MKNIIVADEEFILPLVADITSFTRTGNGVPADSTEQLSEVKTGVQPGEETVVSRTEERLNKTEH